MFFATYVSVKRETNIKLEVTEINLFNGIVAMCTDENKK